MTNKNDKKPRYDRLSASATSFGTQSAVCLGLMVWLGITLDEKYNSSPKWILSCLAFGFLYVFYELWKLTVVMSKDKKKKDERDEVE